MDNTDLISDCYVENVNVQRIHTSFSSACFHFLPLPLCCLLKVKHFLPVRPILLTQCKLLTVSLFVCVVMNMSERKHGLLQKYNLLTAVEV